LEKIVRALGLLYLLRKIGQFYVRQVCKKEFVSQVFDVHNERAIEFSFLFKNLIELAPKTILDVGTGMTALPHMLRNCGFVVSAIDNIRDYWPSSMFNRHFHVIDDDITNSKITQSFDCITCISVLEHIEDYSLAIRTMSDLLEKGSHLIITFPYHEKTYYPNVYKHPQSLVTKEYPFKTQAFSSNEILEWCKEFSLIKIKQEYWQMYEGEYWTCGREVIPPKMVSVDEKHQLTCLLFRKI
jgi:2-polyprenyl-3-methyl-5-hydroxy-6-metoxy-1,4-benzoquinol methylase